MELLQFSDSQGHGIPQVFERFFSLTAKALCSSDLELSNQIENLSISMGEGGFQCGFLLNKKIEGAVHLHQVHSATIFKAQAEIVGAKGDGLYFVAPKGSLGPVLNIRTADCLPIVLAATLDGVGFGAAVHAGWRGYTAGIHIHALEILVREAGRLGIARSRILSAMDVVVGPAIFGSSYECGQDVEKALTTFRSEFAVRYPMAKSYDEVFKVCRNVVAGGVSLCEGLVLNEQKVYPDFQLLAACDLVAAGVCPGRVSIVRENTWESSVLYSYRHATSHGKTEGRRLNTHLVFGGVASVP